ncbi:hypothetical protein [Piscinibacter sp.]|uniref:hypothetical protein n=1 Tax=Piscinibacter sp. TaxID=1903157 RepID=UPI002F428BED
MKPTDNELSGLHDEDGRGHRHEHGHGPVRLAPATCGLTATKCVPGLSMATTAAAGALFGAVF